MRTMAINRMMPSAPAMDRPPMIAGRLAAITPPKTKNSSTATSGMASHLGALLVVADGAGQLVGQRLQAGQLDVDALE